MIADSSPVDGFNGSLGVVRVKLAPLAGFFRWFAQRLAVEREAVRGVHEAVEDGISNCGIDDHLVPMIDGELAGHDWAMCADDGLNVLISTRDQQFAVDADAPPAGHRRFIEGETWFS